MKKLLGLSALVFLLSMCSTEIDLLDDYKETMVVYGLIDQAQTVQYVRIQKAFLGPQNAYIMAQEFDSINYQNELDVRIERYSNGEFDGFRLLDKDTAYDRDTGIFYAPMYVIFSLTDNTGWINDNYTYRIVVNNTRTGLIARSETRPLVPTTISYPIVSTFAFQSPAANYQPTIKWTPVENAMLYESVMLFHYREVDINSNTTMHTTVPMAVGSVVDPNASPVEMKFGEDNFYRFVAAQLESDDNVTERIADSVTFIVYACGPEMYDYMQINGPSSGLSQEKPMYTNIENGMGLWSSRTSFRKTYVISPMSVDSLSRGQFTCDLKFRDAQGQPSVGCQ